MTTAIETLDDQRESPLPERDPRADILSAILLLCYASIFLLGSAVVWSYAENLPLWAFFFRHFNVYYIPFVTTIRSISIALGVVGGVALVYAAVGLYIRGRRQTG